MSALSDLQQAADAIIAFVPGYSTAQQDLATQYGDIDPAAEDAQAKFDALESGPRVALQAVNVEYNALISKMKSLSAAAIAEDATAANALIDNIENLIAPRRGIITNTANSIQAAITKAKVEKNKPAESGLLQYWRSEKLYPTEKWPSCPIEDLSHTRPLHP